MGAGGSESPDESYKLGAGGVFLALQILLFSFTFVSSRKFRLYLVSSKLRLMNYLKKLLSSQLVL